MVGNGEIWWKLDNSKLGSTQQWTQRKWKGEQGDSGDSGESDDSALSGDSGESGDSGDSGESGDSGDTDTLPGSFPLRKYMVCVV